MINWYYGSFGQDFSLTEPSTWPSLQAGMKGDNVRFLQEKLMALGYPFPRFGADGDYGAETETAVTMFQKINNLPATGAFIKQDWQMLLTGNPKKYTSGQVVSTVTQTTKGGSPLLQAFLANKFVTKKNAMIAGAVLAGLIIAYYATKKSGKSMGSTPVAQNPCMRKRNPAPKYWSRYVQTKWHPKEGLFARGSSGEIAREIIKSHSTLRSAMGALMLYINRAGVNLSGERRKVIEDAKDMVSKYFSKPLKYEMAEAA